MKSSTRKMYPWRWVPTLYFAEGLPNTIVCTVSIIIFKQLGMSNTDTAFFSSFLAFPWILKPLWTPLIDLYQTKKFWTVLMQFIMSGCFILAAFAMPLEFATQILLAVFMLMAIISATHDAAADGFYVLGLDAHQQAFFTGVRGTFYRIAMITAQGLVVLMAGVIQQNTGLKPVEFSLCATPNMTMSDAATFGHDEIQVEVNKTTLSPSVITPEVRKKFISEVNEYNLAPTLAVLDELSAASPESMVLMRVFFNRELAENERRQLSLEFAGGDSDIKLLNGERLIFTPHTQKNNLPLLAVAEAGGNVAGVTETKFKINSGNFVFAWLITLSVLGVLYALLGVYHKFAMPTDRKSDVKITGFADFYNEFGAAFVSFFSKKDVGIALAFILCYRFAESQLLKMSVAFVIDPVSKGGLALSNSEYGLIYGTVGVLCLLFGGLLGGWALSCNGLRFWMLPMALALNLPDAVYLFLAATQPTSQWPIIISVMIEQLGYGFGFSVYMLFMMFFVKDSGKYSTSHFAILTGFQAVGLMVPGLFSGYIQEEIFSGSYVKFFIWVMAATVVSFAVTILAMRVVPPEYGRPKK